MTENESENSSQDVFDPKNPGSGRYRNINVFMAEPEIFTHKKTGTECAIFQLKEGVVTALPIEPEEKFDTDGEDYVWRLSLADKTGKSFNVIDYYEAIKWLRQLADYGNTFVIGEKDGYLVTTPLSLEEMKLLVRSVASDNPDSAFGEKTSDKSAGESPRQKKKVSRVDFFADNKKLFFMAWLVALVVHSIRSGEGFGFETVVRGFFFSAFFCFVSFAVGFLILVGLKILLHYHPKISRAICKVTVYISAVTFVLRMMTDIYVEKWGEGVVARSSFSLGTLFAALALYSMYYRGKDGEDYCAQKASEKEWQPVNVVRSGMKDSDRERRAFYPREHAARIFDELKKRAVLPCLKISADAEPEDEPLSLTASKFGGYPYWQEGIEYPTAKDDGTKLVLLAQINFEEISRLNFPLLQSPEFADFPKSGILQFFVKPDEHYGCEFFKINQDKWRAVFHEKVGEPLSKEALRFRGVKSAGDLYETDGACLPLYNEFALSFDAGESFINERCEELLVSAVRRIAAELRFPVPDEGMSIYDIFDEDSLNDFSAECEAGHRIGGYPFFTQDDPRKVGDGNEVLLLQIDSESGYKTSKDYICWGDSGIANFFITREDLKKRDFSHVLYNWDCS